MEPVLANTFLLLELKNPDSPFSRDFWEKKRKERKGKKRNEVNELGTSY